MKKLLALFFSLALVFAFSANTTFATGNYGKDGVDKDCKDFKSQAEAQAYFEKDGGSASNNVDNLDADHDGKACEDYKYKGGSDNKDGNKDDDTTGGSENNNSGNDKSGNNSGSNDSNKDSNQGGKMPKTATNYPIAMFAGALLLLAGVGMATLRLRRG